MVPIFLFICPTFYPSACNAPTPFWISLKKSRPILPKIFRLTKVTREREKLWYKIPQQHPHHHLDLRSQSVWIPSLPASCWPALCPCWPAFLPPYHCPTPAQLFPDELHSRLFVVQDNFIIPGCFHSKLISFPNCLSPSPVCMPVFAVSSIRELFHTSYWAVFCCTTDL